jgi:tRNA (adenine57-N1/adenine58-N1)-methyltransferase catalytic subunit
MSEARAISENSHILIIWKDRRYLKEAAPGKSFHGRGGIIQYSDLFGRPFGIPLGEYVIFEPTLEDLIMHGISRDTQIVYPKDGAFICFRLNVQPGYRVLEAGAGSGALSLIFSRALGPEGRLISYEIEDRHFKNVRRNIQRFGRFDNVDLLHGDLLEYEGEGFDAAFIDVREPWLYLEKVRQFLRPSGMLGMIVPTANQISEILKVIDQGFGDVEVLEIMIRKYKTVAERVRPTDRMIAHTGYLVFARRRLEAGEGRFATDD